MILPFPVKRFCDGHPSFHALLAKVRLPNRDELFRMVVRQGTMEQRVDDAEDRAVCADTQSKRKRYNREETRALTEAANAQAKILRQARYIRQRLAHERPRECEFVPTSLL